MQEQINNGEKMQEQKITVLLQTSHAPWILTKKHKLSFNMEGPPIHEICAYKF